MEAIEAKFSDPSEDLEKMFSEMSEGYRVQIKRVEPEWCNGIVGTFEFDPTEPISTKWIAKRFGGRKLQIKILTPDGKYSGARTLTFPYAPKEDGQELIPGPHGAPILASQAKVEAPPPQEMGLVSALEKIMTAQSQNNQALQGMLLDRVAGLEKLLTQKIETNNNGQQQQQIEPQDPQAQMKSTLETFKMMEELRESLAGNPEMTDDAENPLLSKVMDKMIDKLTAEQPQNDQQAPQQQAHHGAPPLPPRGEPSNLELAQLVKNRLATMDPDEKDFLMDQVFGEEEEMEEIEENQNDAGQGDLPEVESLLSGEDRGILNENSEGTPADNSPEN